MTGPEWEAEFEEVRRRLDRLMETRETLYLCTLGAEMQTRQEQIVEALPKGWRPR